MKIETNMEIVNEQIQESLLHELLDWITFIFTTRDIIVIPALPHIICNDDKEKLKEYIKRFSNNEPLIVKRYGKEYLIYGDFPEFLELTKEEIREKKPIYFVYSAGDYFDRPYSNGSIAIYKFKKPPKRRKNSKLLN